MNSYEIFMKFSNMIDIFQNMKKIKNIKDGSHANVSKNRFKNLVARKSQQPD